MKLNRPPLRQSPETIVSLIDVVFFLLVFFMLIGRMDATAPFEVTPPTASSGADMPAGGITLSVGEDGNLALDGIEVRKSDLADAIQKVLSNAPDTLVRINAHRAAELRHVLPLVGQIEAMGATDVVLVVTPERPGP
jgi:biopolymer transport protein ExbD